MLTVLIFITGYSIGLFVAKIVINYAVKRGDVLIIKNNRYLNNFHGKWFLKK